MKLYFEELFPLLSLENEDEYRRHCRFYFEDQPEILKECLANIDERTKNIRNDNSFALDQCRAQGDISKHCCKTIAKSNDVAYELCIAQIPMVSSSWVYWFLLGLIIVVLFLVYVWRRKKSSK